MTRVSIAMATYNGERFIREQLDSFVIQSRLPDQLIICDDGSSDATVVIAEEFAARAPFPVSIHRNAARLGYSNNFVRAISMCDGDIIFLSDQDDVWFVDKLATVAEAFKADPSAEVVINDQVLTDGELRHRGLTKLHNLRRAGRTSDGMIEGCCTAFRRQWADKVFPIPRDLDDLVRSRDMSHDRWINELATLVERRRVIERPLQYFRRTGQNTTTWVLSEPRLPTLADGLRERQASAPVDAWRRRLSVLDSYDKFLAYGPIDGDIQAAQRKIAHERSSIQQRIELTRISRWRRPRPVWRLLRSGAYRYFEGWMSAANDLVRRR